MLRVLPELDDYNRIFWQGGAEGELRFQYCDACSYYIHPPSPVCPSCRRQVTQSRPVSGRAQVLTYTLNYQPWHKGMQLPLAIAIVGLDEQQGLHLTTNIVDCDPHEVCIGMKVEVVFEQVKDIWLPLFRPVQ